MPEGRDGSLKTSWLGMSSESFHFFFPLNIPSEINKIKEIYQ